MNGNKIEIIINTYREGYNTKQVGETMTVRQLIDALYQYNQNAPVYMSFDNGYTYGGITENRIHQNVQKKEE